MEAQNALSQEQVITSTNFYHHVWEKLRENKVAIVSLLLILLLIVVALFAPQIAPYDEGFQDTAHVLSKPTNIHWLGTDEFGRDIFSRIIYGTRVSLSVGIIAELIAMTIGVLMGALAGYFGGWVDSLISRIIEIFGSFPKILFAIVIMNIIGTGVINVFIAIGMVGWTGMARMIRSQILQLKENEYVEAAHSFGAGNTHIIFKHLIPNTLSTIIVNMTMAIPQDIMYEASLSFLGLGVQPPTSSWGQIISVGRVYISTLPGYVLFPSIALVLTVLAFNLLGDALRDALDPRLRRMD
ncbi:ABC transporter permease [Allofustis seminis]|uniref:ABC transporter permease n=1 Tax=Allofustis seminis TaxID=166939 RepID=UPI000375D5D1|nr:ABC transporter permease [Allofustis seminis]